MLRTLIHPDTAKVPGTHAGTACTTEPSIGAGNTNVNVRFVPLRFVTASFVPAQIWILAVMYSPCPSDRIALGVVVGGIVVGSATALVYSVTRSGMSWHFPAARTGRAPRSATTHANAGK